MKIIILIASMLAGCSYPHRTTDYEPVNPTEGKAAIYLYRTSTAVDSVNPDVPRFFINGNFVGKLLLGGYYIEFVEPGNVEIAFKDSLFGIPFPWKSGKINFTAEAGKTYFAKFEIETIMRITRLGLVQPAIGENELKTTRHLTY